MNKKKTVVVKTAVAGVLLVLFIILSVAIKDSAVAEWLTVNFARGWVWAVGNVTSALPLSLFEALVIIAVFGVLVYLVLAIESIRFKEWMRLLSMSLTVVIVVLAVLSCYTAVASSGYNRKALDLEMYDIKTDGELPYEQAVQLAESIINEINATGATLNRDENGYIIYPYDNEQINSLIAEQYAKLQSDYFSGFTPLCKPVVNSWFMGEMHISGISFLPTAEPHFNRDTTKLYDYPVVVAHEIAHTKGVMREGDANTVAYYITITSSDNYIRYSGLLSVYSQVISLVSLYPNSSADVERLSNSFISGWGYRDRTTASRLYGSYRLFGNIGEFFNNIYLILNGQSGTESYVPTPDISDSGEKDEEGEIIWHVTAYSQIQNMLIALYKDGFFATSQNV